MTIGDLITHLVKNYSDDTPVAFSLWLPADVEHIADKIGVELTTEQIADVLCLVDNAHDAELGISWTTIENAVRLVVSEENKHD